MASGPNWSNTGQIFLFLGKLTANPLQTHPSVTSDKMPRCCRQSFLEKPLFGVATCSGGLYFNDHYWIFSCRGNCGLSPGLDRGESTPQRWES